MKRTALALTLILALFFSAMVGTQFVNLGSADPYIYEGEVPPKPDTIPPTISIFSPKNNTVYSVNGVTLAFDVSGPTGPTVSYPFVTQIYYKTDWQNSIVSVYDSGSPSNQEYSEFSSELNLTGIPDGNHNIIVTAVYRGMYIPSDDPGAPLSYNIFYINGSSIVNFTIDAISILSPQNKTYNVSDIPIIFKASESVSEITYSLDGQDKVTVAGNATLTGLSDGLHTVTVYAETIFGTGSETTQFMVDLPPIVTILSPENKTYGTSNVPLNFTINESVSQITYSLDGQENATNAGNATLTGLSNGEHNLIVYAQDNAGNIGASETIHFSVKVPFPILLVAVISVSVAVIGIGLLVYLKKRNYAKFNKHGEIEHSSTLFSKQLLQQPNT
jgi:hypothetical protein